MDFMLFIQGSQNISPSPPLLPATEEPEASAKRSLQGLEAAVTVLRSFLDRDDGPSPRPSHLPASSGKGRVSET